MSASARDVLRIWIDRWRCCVLVDVSWRMQAYARYTLVTHFWSLLDLHSRTDSSVPPGGRMWAGRNCALVRFGVPPSRLGHGLTLNYNLSSAGARVH